MSINVKNIRNSLNELVDAVGELQQQPAPQPKILDRELSGNKINYLIFYKNIFYNPFILQIFFNIFNIFSLC